MAYPGKKTEGFKSRNAWEVSVYFAERRELYERARDLKHKMGQTNAARVLAKELEGKRTEKGARINFSSIRATLNAMD